MESQLVKMLKNYRVVHQAIFSDKISSKKNRSLKKYSWNEEILNFS